jgi:CBS domain-containing protein
MRVQDIMTKHVLTVTPITTADDAWHLMRLKGIHHLVVVDGTETVGVLSDRDTGGSMGRPVRANRTVGDLMSAPVITVSPTSTIRRAANLMRGRSLGCLVVTSSGRVVGIVTVSDLLKLIGQGLERPVVETRRHTLSHRAPHKKRHTAAGAW